MDHAANVLGALSLTVADRLTEAVTAVAGDPSAAAALSSLSQLLQAPSIERLRQVLGLTHSGTVRLVDRLAEQDLVVRGPGPDGRTAAVVLTGRGRTAARQVARARAGVLDEVLSSLDPRVRDALGQGLGLVLAGSAREDGDVRWTCRLCDTAACGRSDDLCPVSASEK